MPFVLTKPPSSVKTLRRLNDQTVSEILGGGCSLRSGSLLHAGSVVFAVEKRLEDRQNVPPVFHHAPAEFAERRLALGLAMPASQHLRRHFDIPAQLLDRVPAQKQAVEKAASRCGYSKSLSVSSAIMGELAITEIRSLPKLSAASRARRYQDREKSAVLAAFPSAPRPNPLAARALPGEPTDTPSHAPGTDHGCFLVVDFRLARVDAPTAQSRAALRHSGRSHPRGRYHRQTKPFGGIEIDAGVIEFGEAETRRRRHAVYTRGSHRARRPVPSPGVLGRLKELVPIALVPHRFPPSRSKT